MKKKVKNKRGFTLVELSIVLVIVGLLIGGILVGQSLVESAKINVFVRQIQQYDIAVNGFKTKYKCFPGDCVAISQGNGNGLIQTAAGNAAGFVQEIAKFWESLSSMNMIPEKYTSVLAYTSPSSYRRGGHGPKVALGYNTTIYVAGVANPWSTFPNSNLYHIIQPGRTWYDTNGYTSLGIMDVIAIEGKMDDGHPATGNIKASAGGYPGLIGFVPSYAWPAFDSGTTCVVNLPAPTAYNKSTTELCSITIKMLSQVGQ